MTQINQADSRKSIANTDKKQENIPPKKKHITWQHISPNTIPLSTTHVEIEIEEEEEEVEVEVEVEVEEEEDDSEAFDGE